jgi:hypothetical protein
MISSTIAATKSKILLHADKEIKARGRFDKTMRHYSIDGGYAVFETATHAPMAIFAPEEVVISGGVSEIRGTHVATKKVH